MFHVDPSFEKRLEEREDEIKNISEICAIIKYAIT